MEAELRSLASMFSLMRCHPTWSLGCEKRSSASTTMWPATSSEEKSGVTRAVSSTSINLDQSAKFFLSLLETANEDQPDTSN